MEVFRSTIKQECFAAKRSRTDLGLGEHLGNMVLAVRRGYNATLSSHKTEYVVPSTGRYDKFKGKQTTSFSHTGCETFVKEMVFTSYSPNSKWLCLVHKMLLGTHNNILHLHEKNPFSC